MSSGFCSGSRSSTSPRRSIATAASFSWLHRPTRPISGASTLPISALNAISWPMRQLAREHQVGAGPEDRHGGGGVQHLPRQPDARWRTIASGTPRSSALAYFFSHLRRTGRSMPMPLTVSTPPSVSIRIRLRVGARRERLARKGLDLRRHEHGQRQDGHDERDQQQRQLHVVEEHDREVDEDHQQVEHRGDGGLRQEGPYRLVLLEAREDVAGLALGEERVRQRQRVLEELRHHRRSRACAP